MTGSFLYNQRTAEFEFRRGPLFTGADAADEINRTPPKTQSGAARGRCRSGRSPSGRETFRWPSLPRARERPNPDRVRRHLPPARGPARRFPDEGQLRLPSATEEFDVIAAGFCSNAAGGDRARGGNRPGRAARKQVQSRPSGSTRARPLLRDARGCHPWHRDPFTGASPRGAARPGCSPPAHSRVLGPRLRHPRGT